MSKKLLLLVALSMVGTTVAANASLIAKKGPPPNCHLRPTDPRCRNN